jgi:CubicO group peptidase (beta-lactamase class C family)
MSDQSRSLPDQPNLRFLKLEAKQRLAAGEFDTLHNAQLAIAREHGMSSWAVLKEAISGQPDSDSHALVQVRRLMSRFSGASDAEWEVPGEAELRDHFEERFLTRIPSWRLVAQLASQAARFREDLIVLHQEPFKVRAQAGGLQIEAAVEDAAPHRLSALQVYPVGSMVSDRRVTQPPTGRAEGAVPAPIIQLADEALGEIGLTGLVLAGGSRGAAWVTARGWADLDRSETMQPEHRFPALGLTKLITAIGMLRLVADGRVDLDASANDHLRTVRLAEDAVTVRALLTHTGGVETPATLFAETVPDPVSLLGSVLDCRERGTFHYSNGGYAALGQLIADVTEMPYDEVVAGLVLEPLGMTDSSFPSTWPDQDPHAVTGYLLAADGIFVPARRQVCTMPAAAGLWATAADLVRFATGWSALLPDSLVREALTAHAPAAGTQWAHTGLGWLLDPDTDTAGHPGAGPGTAASVTSRLASGQTCVALTNRQVPIQPVTDRAIHALSNPSE